MDSNLRHIAIVPDGNRRWSKLHGVPTLEGHQRGAEVMFTVAKHLISQALEYLTIWGFSPDNWKRSPEEVAAILALLASWLDSHTDWLVKEGVRVRHIGRLRGLPHDLQLAIERAVTATAPNTGMTLVVAFNYSGRAEILDAVRSLMSPLAGSTSLDEATFRSHLYTDGLPDVDLVIRTAGYYRISNFMIWQTAYAEYYFTKTLWPDFDKEEMDKAISEYHERKRTFGGD